MFSHSHWNAWECWSYIMWRDVILTICACLKNDARAWTSLTHMVLVTSLLSLWNRINYPRLISICFGFGSLSRAFSKVYRFYENDQHVSVGRRPRNVSKSKQIQSQAYWCGQGRSYSTVYTRVQVERVYKSNPIFEAKNTTFLEKVWFFSFHQLNKINRWSGIQG